MLKRLGEEIWASNTKSFFSIVHGKIFFIGEGDYEMENKEKKKENSKLSMQILILRRDKQLIMN